MIEQGLATMIKVKNNVDDEHDHCDDDDDDDCDDVYDDHCDYVYDDDDWRVI